MRAIEGANVATEQSSTAAHLDCHAKLPHRRSRRCRTKPRSRKARLDMLYASTKGTKEPESRSEPQPQENGEQHTSRNWQRSTRPRTVRLMAPVFSLIDPLDIVCTSSKKTCLSWRSA